MPTLTSRANIEYEILSLLEATQDTDFRSKVNVWFELGYNDVLSVLRAWWAVRTARFEVQEDGAIYLPPSYLAMMTVYPLNGGLPLTPAAPQQAGPMFTQVGSPTHYLMEGTLLTLLPPQSAGFTARCSYYSKLDPLDDDAASNEYVKRAPSALIYAGAYHGAVYRGDMTSANLFRQSALDSVNIINGESPAAQYGPGVVMSRRG